MIKRLQAIKKYIHTNPNCHVRLDIGGRMVEGYLIKRRIDKVYLPDNVFCYQIRQIGGTIVSLSDKVINDFGGCFITDKKIRFNSENYRPVYHVIEGYKPLYKQKLTEKDVLKNIFATQDSGLSKSIVKAYEKHPDVVVKNINRIIVDYEIDNMVDIMPHLESLSDRLKRQYRDIEVVKEDI